eukprot:CFRG2784T1
MNIQAQPEWDNGSDYDDDRSDDDSIIYNDLKEIIYKRNLNALEKELMELENGTHEEYMKQVADLDSHKERRLEQNRYYCKYLTYCVNDHHKKQKEEADLALEKSKESEKAEMLEALKEKERRIAEERSNDDLSVPTELQESVRLSTRKLRYRTGEDKKDTSEKPKERKTRKINALQGPKYTIRLAEAELTEDIAGVLGSGRPVKAGRRR